MARLQPNIQLVQAKCVEAVAAFNKKRQISAFSKLKSEANEGINKTLKGASKVEISNNSSSDHRDWLTEITSPLESLLYSAQETMHTGLD